MSDALLSPVADPIAHRPYCERPEACSARGAGHCRSCHFRSVAKALHADPDFKAKTAARMKALHADKVKSLGLHEHELSEWRAIKAKGFSSEEAARIVIRSRKSVAA